MQVAQNIPFVLLKTEKKAFPWIFLKTRLFFVRLEIKGSDEQLDFRHN